jgi:Peroxisomal biogenesis factor 11 (PEX11)
MLVKASSNLNCRDKSVKVFKTFNIYTSLCSHSIIWKWKTFNLKIQVIQYGSRMILGFYSKILQDKSINNLQLLLSTCILGRRSFRLFRSINHIQLLVVKLDKLSHKNFFLSIQDRIYVVECIEAFEQLCWVRFMSLRMQHTTWDTYPDM